MAGKIGQSEEEERQWPKNERTHEIKEGERHRHQYYNCQEQQWSYPIIIIGQPEYLIGKRGEQKRMRS
jgi:hypothetical protein